MTTVDVLASAAVLGTFDAADLASLAEEDEPGVEAVISDYPEFFAPAEPLPETPGIPRWRVREIGALRAYVLGLAPRRPKASTRDLVVDVAADPRLGYAEEILVECASARDHGDLRLKASTAMNLTKKCAVEALHAPGAGESINPTDSELPPLVRIDLMLAHLVQAGAGSPPKRRYLRVGRQDLEALHGTIAEDRRRRLVRAFTSLTHASGEDLHVDLPDVVALPRT